MKKLIGILVLMVIVFTSCESKSGKLSRSGQRMNENKENVTQVSTNITVEVIGAPERILVDVSVPKFKCKVQCADSTVCFVLLDNKFEIGDKIEIKPTQRISN